MQWEPFAFILVSISFHEMITYECERTLVKTKGKKRMKIREQLGVKPQDIPNVYYICDKWGLLVANNCVIFSVVEHFWNETSWKFSFAKVKAWMTLYNIFSVILHTLIRGEKRINFPPQNTFNVLDIINLYVSLRT
jgi:hypothetical protein